MMTEFISREAAINRIMESLVHQDSHDVNLHNIGLRKAMSAIDSLPAADVVEVRHGRWIKDGEDGPVCCSECGEEHEWGDYRASYCDTCGAKMDGGQDE